MLILFADVVLDISGGGVERSSESLLMTSTVVPFSLFCEVSSMAPSNALSALSMVRFLIGDSVHVGRDFGEVVIFTSFFSTPPATMSQLMHHNIFQTRFFKALDGWGTNHAEVCD